MASIAMIGNNLLTPALSEGEGGTAMLLQADAVFGSEASIKYFLTIITIKLKPRLKIQQYLLYFAIHN
jgi:hypothetical protein